MSPSPTLCRLEATHPVGRVHVDRRFPGRLLGLSLLTSGPAEGHGFEVDEATVLAVAEHGEGIRGRWTHGGACEDALARHLGSWSELRAEAFALCRGCNAEGPPESKCETCDQPLEAAWRAVGDFSFAPSAWRLQPDGLSVPAPDYLMTRAEEDPASLGISVVARFEFDEEEDTRLARLRGPGTLLRADWVADPAANPTGLSRGDAVTQTLNRLVESIGRERALTQCRTYLQRYFNLEEPAPSALLHEIAHLKAQLGEAATALDTLTQERDALQADLAECVAREQEREENAASDRWQQLVEATRSEAVALGAPVSGRDLARLQSLIEAEDFTGAEAFQRDLLDAARIRGGSEEAPKREGVSEKARSVEVQARVLRLRHWKARISPDGLSLEAHPLPSRPY